MNRKSDFFVLILSEIRHLPLIIVGTLLCALFVSMYIGCASEKKMRQDITGHLEQEAIIRPYVTNGMQDTKPEIVLAVLIDRLRAQGAQLLCWDEKAGVVSWCDAGGYFVPLPVVADKVRIPAMDNRRVTTWRGYVYGCARLTPSGDKTWLTIHVSGRDVASGQRIFSDGTYEWRLLGLVERFIYKISTGQHISPELKEWRRAPSVHTAKSYEDLFRSQFRNIPKFSANEIIAKNSGSQYPVSADRLWIACLDVVTQFDLVPYIESNDRIIIFSRRIAVPIDASSKIIKSVDIIMAVAIKAHDDNTCTMHTILLGKQNLMPKDIAKKDFNNTEEQMVNLTESPLDTAAAIVATELEGRVDVQLFYNENWGNKLLRRLTKR